MSTHRFASGKLPSAQDSAAEQLEADKTAALTRMHPAEVGRELGNPELDREEELAGFGEAPAPPASDYQVRINSIDSGFDSGNTAFQGEVEIEEYLNNEFICRITIVLSVEGEETTPIAEIEERILEQASERLRAAGALTTDGLQMGLKRTRQDENLAYEQETAHDGQTET